MTTRSSHSHTDTGIPGLSFSWKRALGITRVENKISRATGIPLSRAGRERKLGHIFIHLLGWMFLALIAFAGWEILTHPALLHAIEGLFPAR